MIKGIFRINVCTILIIAIQFLCSNFYAQKNKIEFEHFLQEQGLSQNSALCILQDSRGFLWVGTYDGLNKYDGYKFTIFRHNPNDSTSLSNNKVWSIYEDKSGKLWIGTDGGGLNRFDREKEHFIHYIHNPDDINSLSNNSVSSIHNDNKGGLWIGTFGGGLNKLVTSSNEESKPTFILYKNDPKDPTSLSDNRVWSVYKDNSGILWIGTDSGGLNKLIPGDTEGTPPKFIHYKYNRNDPKSLSSNWVSSIYEDNAGTLWIGTGSGGLNKLIPGDTEETPSTFIHYKHDPDDPTSLNNNEINSIYEDTSGNLWIGTDKGGLNKLVISNNEKPRLTFIHYKNDPKNPTSLSNDRILSVYEDHSGVIWIGTNVGLNKFSRAKQRFIHYSHAPDDPSSLSNNSIHAFYEDKSGDLWIGTQNGLHKFDRDKERFTNFTHDPDDPKSLSNNKVTSIYEDNYGVLWIGTYGGINKLVPGDNDRSSPTFVKFNYDPDIPTSLTDDFITLLFGDISGNIWIGTLNGGLNKLASNEKGKSSPNFVHYKHDPDDPTSLSAIRVFSIYEDKNGVLWIGTWGGGLNKLIPGDPDKSFDTFIHYKHDSRNPNSLSNNNVFSIYEDNSGVLWIGTYGGGLNKFDREKEQFTQYRESDGLPNNIILGILEDDFGNLWLSTNKGLSKFNPKAETFRNYDVRDGLQSNEFYPGAYKNKSGEMFFGGINGFNMFHPDSIKDNSHIPPVLITDFQLFNKSVHIGNDTFNNRYILKKSISETEEIKLTHEDYVFTFEFAALDFHSPEKNKYAYIMEGFDNEWTYTDASRRFATYTNLDPGEYTFRVKGSNGDGIWNEKSASVQIIILPPWWRTDWAYILYVLFLAGTIYIVWKLQMKRIRIKHEFEMSKFEAKKLHEIDEMKSRFFANISHEFRTPLTLILGPVKELINKEKDKKNKEELKIVHRNADRLYGLVNQLLDLSKLEAGRMTLKTCEEDIVPILKGLVLSFASLAERKKITLTFHSEKNKIFAYIDVEKVEKIVINILSNAFKFTTEGKRIDVKVSVIQGNAEIAISDEGIGISRDRLENIFDRFYQVDGSHTREQEGTGIGLALTNELVELHKGTIAVESEVGKGTTFTVKLPLGKDNLKPEEVCKEKQENEYERRMPSTTEIINKDNPDAPKTDINIIVEKENPLLLIVEDNNDVRNYIKGYLHKNYRIMESVNGEDALTKAIEQIPDLIVSDVMMPKMDGFELCEKIKTDERTNHIPFILLTAKAAVQDKIDGLETGADDYIMKPFDAKELQVRVKNLIEQREKIVDHYRKMQLFDISDIAAPSTDKKFLNNALEVIKKNISDEKFNVDRFAKEMALSRVQLHRKLIALIGHPPGDFIRIVRLTKAAKLIRSNFGNISEIAFETGFNNPANFAKAFRKHFGLSPSEYKKDLSG